MNSDFMQQQAELVARRIANEPDNAARIRKAYSVIFGRAPTDAELKAGQTFMATEPLADYEERKSARNAKDGKDAKDGKGKSAKAADEKPLTDDDAQPEKAEAM